MKKTWIKILWTILALALLCACQKTGPDPAPAGTAAPRPTAAPTDTPAPADAPASADMPAPTERTVFITEDDGETAEDWQSAFLGDWYDENGGRATMEITEGEAGRLRVVIRWGSSAADAVEWRMTGEKDPDYAELRYENGVKAEVTYGEEGETVHEVIRWKDGAGTLNMEGGRIYWFDGKEENAVSTRFARPDTEPFPIRSMEAEEILAGLVGYAGTAGSSLHEAQALRDILDFAVERHVSGLDGYALHSALNGAFYTLTEEQRQELAENASAVCALGDEAFADFESVRGLLEDAGAAEDVEALLGEEDILSDWETIRDQLLTIGNIAV